jgi:hypothetical protein
MTSTTMQREWALHYASWMIADGCPERKVGEIFDWFAIKFWNENGLVMAAKQSRSVNLVADFKYQVVAEVTYLSEKASVIDFGLNAIATLDLLPDGCMLGDYIAGEISIGFPLCTEVSPDDVLESLKHKWQVKRIQADLTPYIEHLGETRYFCRDGSQIRYEEVRATDEVRASDYVLLCSEIG